MNLAQRYARTMAEAFGVEAYLDPLGDVQIARGDHLLDEGQEDALKSALPGVSDERWTQFCRGMAKEPFESVSDSNALGTFSMTPRRLADLGIVENLQRTRSPTSDRTIWVAVFVAPLTAEKFLRDPELQYVAFCRSCRDYADQMNSGRIQRDPAMSQSGALAILHRAGPKGLDTWSTGERFPETEAAYDRVAGIF